MMDRMSRATLICVGAALLTACDNTPNPNFEQEIKDKFADAYYGDVYVVLSQVPQPYRLDRRADNLRQASIAQEALGLRASYESMLTKLDADTKVVREGEPFESCRAAFAGAVAFQQREGVDARSARALAEPIIKSLRDCRERAYASEKARSSEMATNTGMLLRRFGSTGMVLVSLSIMSFGDEAGGRELWRRSLEAVEQDKPGFKLTPRAFLAN